MADVVRNYKIRYGVEDTASGPIGRVGRAAQGTEGQVQNLTTRLKPLADGLWNVAEAAESATETIWGLGKGAQAAVEGVSGKLSGIASAIGRVDFNAKTATGNVDGLGIALGSVSGQAAGISGVQTAVQATQRSTYGLWMNAQEAAGALNQVAATAPKIGELAVATNELGASLQTTGTASKGTTSSFGGLMAALMALQAADHVVSAIGDSIRSAREDTEGWAADALKLRNELRELANLQGKPGADDQVVAKHLALRAETGMTQTEARKFDEQFRGSLPLAKDAGGVTDEVAGKLSIGVGRLATRVGLDGATAGDLAGVMGAFGKIPDEKVGLGRAQQIVDLLNDGRGNLTPLTKELLKDAGSTVGEGKMFRTLPERAAAVSVSTGLGSIGRSSTRINQAIAGLSGFDKTQGDALKEAGIKGDDDFETRIRKIAPLVAEARKRGVDPLGFLAEKGFKNQVEQKAIVGFVDQYDALKRRTDSVRENPNSPDPNSVARQAGSRSSKLNDQFFSTDKAARDRVAEARLEAAKLGRGKSMENLAIERKEAEADLQQRKAIDTPGTNMSDALLGGFGLAEKLGAPSGRQMRIDSEIKRKALEALEHDLGRPLKDWERKDISENGPKYSADYLASRRARMAGGQAVKPPQVQLPGGQPNGPAPQAAPGQGNVPQGTGGLLTELRDIGKGIQKLVALADQPRPLAIPQRSVYDMR